MSEIIEKKIWTLIHPMDEQNVKDALMNILRKNSNHVVKVSDFQLNSLYCFTILARPGLEELRA